MVPCAARSYEHPARAAEVHWRGRELGESSNCIRRSSTAGRRSSTSTWKPCSHLSQAEKRYTPPLRYPSSAFDLSVIAGSRELAGDLLKRLIRFVPEGMLQNAEYVRQYLRPALSRRIQERLLSHYCRLGRTNALLGRSWRNPQQHYRRYAGGRLRASRLIA